MNETRILASGDTVIILELGTQIDWRISRRVHAINHRLAQARPEGVIETVPTFRSLAVHYDPDVIGFEALSSHLQGLAEDAHAEDIPTRLWRIPGCYDGEFGPDIADIAERTGLKPEQVVDCHASQQYLVYMLGFLPGYPYMGDVPDAIALPRRETPRLKVPHGSIALATTMTAIYTLESPGGWHILGRTPVSLFDVARSRPALLAPGDRVVFEPVTPDAFHTLGRDIASGRYRLSPEDVPA